jgi:hypothetical protein
MRLAGGRGYNVSMASARISGWVGWYRFACERLGYGHKEAVTYANLRSVEEMNRQLLRSRTS